MPVRVDWEGLDQLKFRLLTEDDRILRRLEAVLDYAATEIETYAKARAPWTDRTGLARQTLNAKANKAREGTLTVLGIVLAHGMPYGYWLEVAHNKKYAIILPTLEATGPQVMEMLNEVIS